MSDVDEKLKQTLAKMLPDKIAFNVAGTAYWKVTGTSNQYGVLYARPVEVTELLHLCALAEKAISEGESLMKYFRCLESVVDEAHGGDVVAFSVGRATWQQKVVALAKINGVEITHA